jgi:hypothetical protein
VMRALWVRPHGRDATTPVVLAERRGRGRGRRRRLAHTTPARPEQRQRRSTRRGAWTLARPTQWMVG